jgi:hypothetical protein
MVMPNQPEQSHTTALSSGTRTKTISFKAQTGSTQQQPITFAIRTDASHASERLVQELSAFSGRDSSDVLEVVKAEYGVWGYDTLQAFTDYIDYTKYGLEQDSGLINVQLHKRKDLSDAAIANAVKLTRPHLDRNAITPLLITLDEMIDPELHFRAELAFSRLFDIASGKEKGFVQRPGKIPLDEQLAKIFEQVKKAYLGANHGAEPISGSNVLSERFTSHSKADREMRDILRMADSNGNDKVPIVLLEDNVRRAKMLNWIIDKMDAAGIFQYATLAGISTCFCNATEEERANIKFNGRRVPIIPVIDYGQNLPIDITTTRDLMFDGFVIDINGELGRLPGIYMDVSERFKIAPKFADAFRHDVALANKGFCDRIEKEFGITPPIEWFDSGRAIAHVTGAPLSTPMAEVMRDMASEMSRSRVVQFAATPKRRSAPVAVAK